MQGTKYSILSAICFTILMTSCAPPKVEFKTPEVPKVPDIGTDPEKAVDYADATASGGQPGKITLNGVIAKLAKTNQGPGSSLQVETETGTGWRGIKPELKDDSAPVLNEILTEDQKNAIGRKFETPALAFGCSEDLIKKHIGTFDPASAKFDEKLFNDSIKTVSAEKILLCGKNPLVALAVISITAKELILQDVSIDLMEIITVASLSIQTSKLSVYGKNTIGSIAMNRQITIGSGPALNISVQDDLTLDGSLKIFAKGSSFKKAK